MVPEVELLNQSASLVRIPPECGVPLSARVRRLIDTPAMQRLSSISQLGMVGLVYPGAKHSRMEHSLGVYYNALRFLARFSGELDGLIDERAADAFVLSALVHDIGHWPFCHPIEDMRLEGLEEHESRVQQWLSTWEISQCIERDWNCEIADVAALLNRDFDDLGDRNTDAWRFLASCLSGPIDVDKLDYLIRDSLHAGVPYGRNFDVGRLISSLCLHPEKPVLAVGEKGRTAAEMMVFSRYIMFSEVYWHHAVRSATAMLQRAVFLLQNRIDLQASLQLTDADWIAMFRRAAEGSVAEPLAEGVLGPRRELYKRVAEFSIDSGVDVHHRLARRPYWWLVACSEEFAKNLHRETGIAVSPADVLIDAPPVQLEVDINVDVIRRDRSTASLGDVSPVVAVLAKQQFDDHVKKVRVFVRPSLREPLREKLPDTNAWAQSLASAIEATESSWV